MHRVIKRCRFGHTHEQRYGLITSLTIHTIVFLLFFTFSLVKSSNDVKTYYIQLNSIDEQPDQSAQHVSEIKKTKVTQPKRNIIRGEKPVIQESPVKEREAVIKSEVQENTDSVKMTSAPEPSPQPQTETHQSGGGSNPVSNVSYSATSGDIGMIETEFGSSGAPAFLRKQMPVYPIMAKKLGKQGKVVLRLFIDEKGRLLNVEVVEGAGYGFTESAVEAVKMSTFVPAHEKGRSVASKALLTIRFVLKKV